MATLKCSIITSCVAWFSLFTFFFLSTLTFLFFLSILCPNFSIILVSSPTGSEVFSLQTYYCTYFPFCLLSKCPSHFPCLQSTKWDGQGLIRTAHGKAASWDSKVERFSRSLESEVSQASPRKLREASCCVFLSWGSHSFLHELLSPSASPFCLSLFVSLYLSCAFTPSPFV